MTSPSQVPIAGRLQYFYDQWCNITDDPIVLSWVQGYSIPFKSEPIQIASYRCSTKSIQEIKIIDQCIESLLQSDFISTCEPCKGQFLSPIFTVPKPNGKHRFILNLKHLNKFVQLEHFKMEDFRTVLKLLNQNHFMSTLDLKDAYFLISIDKNHRKKLRFEWKSQLYEFNVLCFGLCTAPFVFTKLLKPVSQYLRSQGLISVNYLDDFLLIGQTYNECVNNVTKTMNVLQSLGFVINFNKSQITPKTECKFLGFIFNTNNMSIYLPEEKKQRIRKKTIKFLKLKKCTIRYFAEFIGLLTSACPAVRYGWMYTKMFERQKFLALGTSDDYNRKMIVASSLKEDLEWWKYNILRSKNPIFSNNYCLEIYSDASTTGWGVACDKLSSHGNWTQSELASHINILELKAAFYGLKIFASKLRDCDILLRVDNTTAICYINRMGGIQHTHLNDLARTIWQWCELRNINIFASYIKSSDNIIADRESRKVIIDTEWELAEYAFTEIINVFGNPEFDLFASSQNYKCSRYASWKLDPYSETVDAFTFTWKNLYFYAFPPFSMITKVLQKIITDKAEGILVVPFWRSQPWYPLWTKLIVSNKIFFGPDKYLLNSPVRTYHPLHADLVLVAAKLSGKR